jgi:hypothetical protein
MDKRFFVALSLAGLVSTACGLISGVSDDYTYDAGADSSATGTDASLVDGSVTTDSSVLPDSSSPDAARVDASADAGLCPGSISKPSGVSEKCALCMLTNCCTELQACNKTQADIQSCSDYLKCVDSCAPSVVGDACRLACRQNTKDSSVATKLDACASAPNTCVPLRCNK